MARSPSSPRPLAWAALASLLLAAVGCGRSPSTPDPSTPAAVGPEARCAAFIPSADDDEVDEKRPVPCEHRGVVYVPMAKWEPSERVKTLEKDMADHPRVGPGGYMTFPELTSHRPIGGTTWSRGWGRRRR